MAKKLSEFLPPKFHSVWGATLNQDILNIVCRGGRGSGKSSDTVHIATQLLMRYAVNAVGIRHVDNTLEQSIYKQMKQAIGKQGVSRLFKFSKSPLKITYLPRGNYITLHGAQNPERIRSLKDGKFPFAIGWVEELAEFKTEDEVTTITNSLLCGELDGGLFYKLFYSYSPPKRKQSWVNKKYETSFQPNSTFIHHSIYWDNPFIFKEFLGEVETIRASNPRRAEWEYSDKAVGPGVVPLDNLQVKKGSITDEMISNFDNICNGLDYGYATDPLAFARWHHNERKNGIYAIDKIYGTKVNDKEFVNKAKSKGYQNGEILSGNAEPKSNAELVNEYGMRGIEGMKRGPDSVEHGEQWLDNLALICIDPLHTPNIAREFGNIDYQADRNGDPRPKLEDKDDHTIDATRYVFNEDMWTKKKSTVTKEQQSKIRRMF